MSGDEYAGFWLRVGAFVIDAIVLAVVYLLLIIPLDSSFAPDPEYEFTAPGAVAEEPAALESLLVLDFSQLILILTAIVYFAMMEASRYQASLGKMALELKVTDARGGRLTLAKALLRNVSKMLSSLPLMAGHIVTAFTKKKQALHDLIAGALVIKQ